MNKKIKKSFHWEVLGQARHAKNSYEIYVYPKNNFYSNKNYSIFIRKDKLVEFINNNIDTRSLNDYKANS